jgi:hypothetical protein
MDAEGLRCVELELSRRDADQIPATIRSRDLREMPIAAAAEAFREHFENLFRGLAEGQEELWAAALAGKLADAPNRLKPVPARAREDRYKLVAAVYRTAQRRGLPPTKAVANAFGIPRGSAAALVNRTRKAGHMGAAPDKGQPGEATTHTEEAAQ